MHDERIMTDSGRVSMEGSHWPGSQQTRLEKAA